MIGIWAVIGVTATQFNVQCSLNVRSDGDGDQRCCHCTERERAWARIFGKFY